jgi:cardiolipin synthase
MAPVIPPQGEDRILTAANAFTTVRLLCVPIFVFLLTRPHHRDWFPAAVLLAGLGATDWVDGQLARRLHQVTRLGRVLDPTADRILLATATIGIVAVGAVPVPIAAVALVREGLVATGAIGLALARAAPIDVRLAGKAGTFGLMCALPLFLAGHSNIGWHATATVLAWISALIGLALGWVAVAIYVPLAAAALHQRRTPRTEEASQ